MYYRRFTKLEDVKVIVEVLNSLGADTVCNRKFNKDPGRGDQCNRGTL